MSDFKPKPGTFLPYMEYRNREKAAEAAPASPITLLEILNRQPSRSLPLFDLQTLSGMEPSRYSAALKSLLDAGYVVLEGEALAQVVRLTDSGAKVLELARPA